MHYKFSAASCTHHNQLWKHDILVQELYITVLFIICHGFSLSCSMRIPFLYASPVLIVFSCSATSESALIKMQLPQAQRSSVSKLMSSVRAQDHSQLTDSEGMTAHFPGLLFTTAWRLCSADSLHTALPARVPGRECWHSVPICQHSRAHTYTHRYSTGIERLVQILPTSVSQADESHNRTFPCQQYLQMLQAHFIFFSWRFVQSSWEPNLGLQESWKYP